MVMLDFYADWCIACKEMDRYTFSDPQVQAGLSNMMVLRADITHNNTDDKALMRRYGVVAPPTLLFFNDQGDLIDSATIVGEMNAKGFNDHLKQLQK